MMPPPPVCTHLDKVLALTQIPRALSTDRSVKVSTSDPSDCEHRDPRARILASAERIFAEKGYAAASLREIAATARVTKPMIYYYFDSKDGLFRTLMEELHQRLDDELAGAFAASSDPREQLVAIARTHIAWATERAQQWRLMVTSSLGPSESRPACAQENPKRGDRTLLDRAIGSAARTGMARSQDLEVTLFVARGVVHACYESALVGSPLPSHPDLPERIVALLWEGIGTNPERIP